MGAGGAGWGEWKEKKLLNGGGLSLQSDGNVLELDRSDSCTTVGVY